jgi:repressor LexA
MPKPLSDLERRVLDYLVEYLRQNTYQPSIREIGRRFDIKSTKTVSELLQSLADKGWIERDPSRSRGVRLLGLEMNADTVTVPWYDRSVEPGRDGRGRVLGAFEMDRKLAGPTGTFMIAMPDDALSSDGIRKGDLLLVEPVRPDAMESGDLVVARAQGAQLVRRLQRRGAEIALESSSVSFPPLTFRQASSVELVGRVVSVVRRLRVPVQAPTDPTPSADPV